MDNSYNQFFIPQFFLSALRVSNESSRSSSGVRHNILYYTVQSVQSCRLLPARLACTIVPIVLCNTVYYAVLLMMND